MEINLHGLSEYKGMHKVKMKYVYILLIILVAISIGCSTKEKTDSSRLPDTTSQSVTEHDPAGRMYTAGDTTLFVDTIDLDGNGIDETIRLKTFRHSGDYTLSVDDISYTDRGSNLFGSFKIVDIDSTDTIKEIAVSEAGPSDDVATHFYYYDDRKIIHMGILEGIPRIDGSGLMGTIIKGRILHTWNHAASYTLSEDHKIVQIEEALYTMDWKVILKDTLALLKSKEDSEIITILLPGEEATILLSDDKEWCFAENSKGVKGWFAVDGYDIIRGTGKHAREIFHGLSNAD